MRDKAAGYLKSIHLRLNKYILPYIGNLKLSDIKSPVILKLCRQIEMKEFLETSHRVRALIGQVFRFAIASGWINCSNLQLIILRSLGFTKEQITPHGFRAMFSTIANEHEFNRDVIERELAHVPDNAIRGAYNHAEYLPQRARLMQWWADWLDGLN